MNSSVTAPRSAKGGAPMAMNSSSHQPGADAQRQPAFRQIIDGGEDLRRQHGGPMRHHHHRGDDPQLRGRGRDEGRRCQLLQPTAAAPDGNSPSSNTDSARRCWSGSSRDRSPSRNQTPASPPPWRSASGCRGRSTVRSWARCNRSAMISSRRVCDVGRDSTRCGRQWQTGREYGGGIRHPYRDARLHGLPRQHDEGRQPPPRRAATASSASPIT